MGLKKGDQGGSARLLSGPVGMFLLGQVGLIAFVVGLSACTRTLPYKKIPLKENVISKSLIDTSAEYIYVPSTGATSRTIPDSRPFYLGHEKIVKLEMTWNALQAYEVEMDANYQGNPQNRRLAFEIPITHVEYHCQKDSLNNCTNQEEENNRISWDQKSEFIPDFSRVNVTEIGLLPESIGRLLPGLSCMKEVSSKPLDYEVHQDYINFRIERTMTNDIECVETLDYLSDLTSSIVSNYSLVKLSTMSTQGYKVLNYPRTDERIFGFFKSERAYTDVDNVSRINQEVHLLNRWGPRSEIVYYLSDEFNKPENELLKKAAYTTVIRVNDGLAIAKVPFRLRLEDPRGINTGDMRYNMIILVEDPVAGLLGYGPSVVHPRTGEILTGRVAIYPGNIKQLVQRTYQEIREERQKKALPKGVQGKVVDKEGDHERAPLGESVLADRGSSSLEKGENALRNFLRNWKEPTGGSLPTQSGQLDFDKKVGGTEKQGTQDGGLSLTEDKRKELEKFMNSSVFLSEKYDPKNDDLPMGLDPIDMLMSQRHSCLLRLQEAGMGGFELSSIDPGIIEALNEKFGSGELRAWEKLSASEKQFVLDLMMPESFAGILIHELGHNLGLRHNFDGSEDKENFYTKKEFARKDIDYVVQSSSVMEYLGGLHGLPIFGKYDIAALRFGYRRELTKADGTILRLQGTLEEEEEKAARNKKDLELRKFKYCTDEGVGLNAGCKRFDSGTTYSEIADGLIQRYDAFIKRNAYRRSRAYFSLHNSVDYAMAVNGLFYDLRTFMEVSERVKYLSGIPYNDTKWVNDEFLVDLRQAAAKAGKFLKGVLETPDQTCIVGSLINPSDTPDIDLFSKLKIITKQKKAMHCSELDFSKLLPPFNQSVALGEVGRPFNDVKSLDLENWRLDQIDVRGSWIDKTLAAKYLFARRFQETAKQRRDLFDEHTDSFMDLPELREDLYASLLGIMKDKSQREYEVSRPDGKQDKITVPLNVLATHDVVQQLSSVTSFLKVPSERAFHFIEVLGQQMVRQKASAVSSPTAVVDLNAVGIYKTPRVVQSVLPDGAYSAVIDGTRYVALENNYVARSHLGRPVVLDILVEAIELAGQGKDNKEMLKQLFQPVIDIREKNADPKQVLPKPSAVQRRILGLEKSAYEDIIKLYSIIVDEDSSFSLAQAKTLLEEFLSKKKRVLDMLPVLNEM